jgi:chromosome segregation ATPase
MTDAMDVRETLRKRARDARVMLMDAHPTISYEDAAVVALLNVATEQIDTLTRERDEAVKRRREIDDEAFDYAEQIETLRTQLAAARAVIEAAKALRDSATNQQWVVANGILKPAVDALRALEGDA